MNNLGISAGDKLRITKVDLPLASYIKIQPHQTAFIELSNPKAILEKELKKFTCVTQGDVISIHYLGEVFNISILETKPDTAVCLINTDVKVDFEQPLDYVEPKPQPKAPEKHQEHVLDDVDDSDSDSDDSDSDDDNDNNSANSLFNRSAQSPESKIKAFTGAVRTLDGNIVNAPSPSQQLDQSKPVPSSQPSSSHSHILEEKQEQKPSFVPFSGQGRTLG